MPEAEVEKKRKLRFSCFDDINLLKEAVRLNPFEDNRNWRTVHINFMKTANKPFTLRAIKDHVEHLLVLYKKKDLGNLRRGKVGTEKLHTEKEQLLKELFSVKERFGLNKKKKKQELKFHITSDPAIQLTEAKEEVLYESTKDPELTDPDSSAPPICATPFLSNILENSEDARSFCKFILGKCASSTSKDMSTGPIHEILKEEREKGVDFEKRKLSLEEKKVELESRRLALEEAKLKYFLESQKQQHQLMLVLIEKITNPIK